MVHASAGHRLSSAGLYSEAAWELQTAEELGALFSWHLRELAYVSTRMGNEEGAIAARRAELERQGATREELTALDAATAKDGLLGYWDWMRRAIEGHPDPNPFEVAEVNAALGDRDEALLWLARTLDTDILWFLHGQRSPAFDELRDDPRYLDLVGAYPLWHPPAGQPAKGAGGDREERGMGAGSKV